MGVYMQDPDYNKRIRQALGNTGTPKTQVWLADWKKHGFDRTNVYVISPDNDCPCKIGVSKYGYRRMLDMQVAVWRPLKVDYSVWVEGRKDAYRLEAAIHADLSEDGKWMHGEWFDIRPPHAIDMIRFKASVLGIEISDEVDHPEIVEEIRTKMNYLAHIGILFPKNAEMG